MDEPDLPVVDLRWFDEWINSDLDEVLREAGRFDSADGGLSGEEDRTPTVRAKSKIE